MLRRGRVRGIPDQCALEVSFDSFIGSVCHIYFSYLFDLRYSSHLFRTFVRLTFYHVLIYLIIVTSRLDLGRTQLKLSKFRMTSYIINPICQNLTTLVCSQYHVDSSSLLLHPLVLKRLSNPYTVMWYAQIWAYKHFNDVSHYGGDLIAATDIITQFSLCAMCWS